MGFLNILTSGVLRIPLIILGVLILLYIIFKLMGFVSIGTDSIGIVEKWWSPKGSVPSDGLIALKGEAGFQPGVLRAGVHFKTPLQYKVKIARLVTIPQGQIGYVFARSGEPLKEGQATGKVIPECKSFQDVREFLENGGQKGPQRQVLREGTYAFNLAQFIIITKDKVYSIDATKEEAMQIESMRAELAKVNGFSPVLVGTFGRAEEIEDTSVNQNSHINESQGFSKASQLTDTIGIVTVNEGPTPDDGSIIAPIIGGNADSPNYHNNFQEPEKFLAGGGRKGKQLQVLTDGVYFINRLFASVKIVPKTVVPVGYVGVVISYYGDKGADISGADYSHGELAEQGKKGIWKDALLPGKYAFNTYAGKVMLVPTTNVILKWVSGETGDHKLDANLKEISLITKDAFEPNLPLTVVFNIDYRKASSVIQRFGDVKMLVEQTLDPMVAGYFKNIGQTKTLIELVQDRSTVQKQASEEMKERFKAYDLELQDVLIGTPAASASDTRIEKILAQLRDRQVAIEEVKTNEAKLQSAAKQKELNEAQAKAVAQADLTKSAIDIEVADNKGKAQLKLAEQEALKTRTLSEADRYKREQEAAAQKYSDIAKAEAKAKEIELQSTANATSIRITGEAQASSTKAIADADAEREQKVGLAKGQAAKALVDAYGGPELQVQQSVLTAFAKALESGKIAIVPQTVIGASDGKVPNAIEGIMNLVMANMVTNGAIQEEMKKAAATKEKE